MKEDIGVYIHIPFCKSKCYYCDFASYANIDCMIEKYVNSLCGEILQNAELLSGYNIKSIYIGGGTPSYINEKYIGKILTTLYMFVDDKLNIEEITLEVNPATCNLEKFKSYKALGVNRISLGVQSTHDEVLKNIGRAHKFADVISTLDDLKKAEFINISVDLIYPLPSLDFNKFKESLENIVSLSEKYNIKHISLYNLEVHSGTKLDFLLKEGFLSLPNEDEEYEMKRLIDSYLPQNGFSKYEISNYAKDGFYSKHNTMYWKQLSYLGFGAGASSFIYSTRYDNMKDIKKYVECIENGMSPVIEKEQMDKLDLMKEYVILNLRMMEGIDIVSFRSKFKTDIFDIFATEIKNLRAKGLLEVNDSNICLTKRGEEVANLVWQEFI